MSYGILRPLGNPGSLNKLRIDHFEKLAPGLVGGGGGYFFQKKSKYTHLFKLF
jgi:hypothetical protein